MKRSLIVAMSENGVIGRNDELPWRLSGDLRRFKRITMGHHILMGRKTYESIGRLLPGRTTLIVSRQSDYSVPGAVVAPSLEAAWQAAAGDDEVFVVGGGQLYEAALPLVDRLYVTRVQAEIEGDTRFPQLDWNEWNPIHEEQLPVGERDEFATTFQIYDRAKASVPK